MIAECRTSREPIRSPTLHEPLVPYEVTATAALLAVELAAEAEDGRDEVHGAALESFPASDPPSWGALRAGPPAGRSDVLIAPAGVRSDA